MLLARDLLHKISCMSSSFGHEEIELDNIPSSSARPADTLCESSEPLLSDSSVPSTRLSQKVAEQSLSGVALRWLFSLLPVHLQRPTILVMARLRTSKAATLLTKLQTDSEPGLSSAQLMLTNHDLKPVEPARRQWGPWNFVGMFKPSLG